jgi:phosphate transport system protein
MRKLYYDQLDAIIGELVAMTGTVRLATRKATDALLEPDLEAAEQVISADAEIDRAREEIEDKSFELLARQQPVAGDLRMLVAALRMVSDLERMGDLAVHVAKVARLRYPVTAIPPEFVDTIATMAVVAERMIGRAAQVVADRDIDQLRASSFRILLSKDWPYGVEPAIDIALLGRYYERIADHAVSMAKRVVYLVTGERAVPIP